VSHLATGACFGFAVEVQLYIRVFEGGGPVGFAFVPEVAQQVRHGGRAQQLGGSQGQTAHRTQLLFKLARHAGIKRKVSGIVRPWGQFVNDGALFRHKKFHA